MQAPATRTCCICGEEKDLFSFHRKKNGLFGRDSRCKTCKHTVYVRRRPLILEKALVKRRDPVYRDKMRSYLVEYRKKNLEVLREKQRAFYYANWNKCRAQVDAYQSRNREVLREKRRPYLRAYDLKRYHTDVEFRLRRRVRGLVLQALRRRSSTFRPGSTVSLLEVSLSEFRKHLESLFYSNPETGEEMTWGNHGVFGWHLDHIEPLSSFDLEDEEQLRAACRYTNIRPLWWKENLRKGARAA